MTGGGYAEKTISWISRGLAFWVFLGGVLVYHYPDAFSWTRWSAQYVVGGFLLGGDATASSDPYDLPGQAIFKWMFAVTMFAIGTVIDPRNFSVLVRQPLAVLLGILTQFTVMPALAFAVARFCGFDDSIALGFIIVGCAPGAMTSNVLTYLARGDAAYSVTLTTTASILSVYVTPSLVMFLAGADLGMTTAKFWEQLWTIAWTVATPLVLGLTLRVFSSRWHKFYELFSPAMASLAIIVICCAVIHWTRDYLNLATPGVFLGVVLVNALGLVLGGALARLYRLNKARQITLAIEVGMQNAGMGVVLATTTFSERKAVAIPAALFTLWCIFTASGLIAFLKRRRAVRMTAE